jgi:hypothetical protein
MTAPRFAPRCVILAHNKFRYPVGKNPVKTLDRLSSSLRRTFLGVEFRVHEEAQTPGQRVYLSYWSGPCNLRSRAQ